MPAGSPAPFIAGVTAPQYGMPISGTPIGLPGPPHIPLGVPAGLQKHVIANHTQDAHSAAGPQVQDRRQAKKPGFSYPKPVSHVSITEHKHMPPVIFRQPHRRQARARVRRARRHGLRIVACVEWSR